MARTDRQFNLRMPAEQREWVEKQAKLNCRSVNSELVFLIAQEKQRQEKIGS